MNSYPFSGVWLCIISEPEVVVMSSMIMVPLLWRLISLWNLMEESKEMEKKL